MNNASPLAEPALARIVERNGNVDNATVLLMVTEIRKLRKDLLTTLTFSLGLIAELTAAHENRCTSCPGATPPGAPKLADFDS